MSLTIGQTIVTVPDPDMALFASQFGQPFEGFATEVVAILSDLTNEITGAGLRDALEQDAANGADYGFPLTPASTLALVRQSGEDGVYGVVAELVGVGEAFDPDGMQHGAAALLIEGYGEAETIPWERLAVLTPDDFDASDFE